jgi:hypothetical protein
MTTVECCAHKCPRNTNGACSKGILVLSDNDAHCLYWAQVQQIERDRQYEIDMNELLVREDAERVRQ